MPHDPNLLALWRAGVDAVGGDTSVQRAISTGDISAPDRIVAVGKAAAAMAMAAARQWPNVPCLIVTKYDHTEGAPRRAHVIEAAHPVPDGASVAAGHALMKAVDVCAPGSHLLMLVSGGASSLAEVPAGNMTLEALKAETQALLASGTPIGEMNAHRTSRSKIKGGKLLSRFKGARVTTLALSDVEGDSLATIGSGIGDAPAVSKFHFLPRIIASNEVARNAVAAVSPVPVLTNSETLYDDVAELAPKLGRMLRDAASGLHIFGGEPVVHLPEHPGQGGRNMALGLALAREIAGTNGLRIIVAGTDGTDGPTDAAGAMVDGQTWDDSGAQALARADAYPWLRDRNALVVTGPTGTNVMDLLIAHKA